MPGKLTDGQKVRLLGLLHNPEVARYLREINRFYRSWEEVRHRPRPHGLRDEEAWWLV